jgi:hypothetical protein
MVIAFNVSGAEDFQWQFDPDTDPGNGNEIIYTRGSGNPGVRLSWVSGLIPGQTYNVAVRVMVQGQWGQFSTSLPIDLALPPNNVSVRAQFCGLVLPDASGIILAESVCSADIYEWEFDGPVLGTATTGNYAVNLANVNPPLQPGVYNVRVKVTQEGVPGDFGPSCAITIGSPGAEEEGDTALRSEILAEGTIFPNPNRGEEIQIFLDALGEKDHLVSVSIFDSQGKRIQQESFNHFGNAFNTVLVFDQNLRAGVYVMQILIDNNQSVNRVFVVE